MFLPASAFSSLMALKRSRSSSLSRCWKSTLLLTESFMRASVASSLGTCGLLLCRSSMLMTAALTPPRRLARVNTGESPVVWARRAGGEKKCAGPVGQHGRHNKTRVGHGAMPRQQRHGRRSQVGGPPTNRRRPLFVVEELVQKIFEAPKGADKKK